MKTMVTIVVLILLVAAPAAATELEPGATFFDDHTCVEADGTPGLGTGDGQCITTADYDALYSYDNLASTPSIFPGQGHRSVAEVYDVKNDVASDRLLGEGFVKSPRTFKEIIGWWHPGGIR